MADLDSSDCSPFIILDSTGTCESEPSLICLGPGSINRKRDQVGRPSKWSSSSTSSCIIIPDTSTSEDDEIQVIDDGIGSRETPEDIELIDSSIDGGRGLKNGADEIIARLTNTSIDDGNGSSEEAEEGEIIDTSITDERGSKQGPGSHCSTAVQTSFLLETKRKDLMSDSDDKFSTPSDRVCKRRRIGSLPLSSTPLAGSSEAPQHEDEPMVTPITVRYERIRAELSATKKEQAKIVTALKEELQGQQGEFLEMKGEMQKFREEMESKRKREEEEKKREEEKKKKEEEERKRTASIPLDVKSDQDSNSMLRPVIIDGSNVAMSHGNRKIFSCKGIALCIQFFQQRGHTNITAMVPLHRKTRAEAKTCPIKDAHLLDELEAKGLLSFTPSRYLNGRRLTPYDDRMMLQLACRNEGVVVSNDNFRDLMKESADFKYVIERRLIMYTFVGDNFMVPEDPHGRYGPSLSEVLKRSVQVLPPAVVHSALYNQNRRTPLQMLMYPLQNMY